jgi:hypothetical protein
VTQPPDDVRPDLLWYRTENGGGATVNPDRHPDPCRTYWGSHGCARPAGHDGDHWCDCCACENHPDPDSGCVAGPPYYGPELTVFTTDDKEGN